DPIDLVVAGLAADLEGDLQEPEHPGGADGVGGEDAAGAVPGDVAAVDEGGTFLGELPAVTLVAEAQVLQPHRLVPAERDVDLGAVEVLPGVGDAGLPVDVGGALPAGPRVDLVAAGEHRRLRPH